MRLISFFNAIVWGVCFYLLLGTPTTVVLAIILAVLLADWLDLGRGRALLWRIGLGMMVVTIFVEAGALPYPAAWGQSIRSMWAFWTN